MRAFRKSCMSANETIIAVEIQSEKIKLNDSFQGRRQNKASTEFVKSRGDEGPNANLGRDLWHKVKY